MSSRSLPVVAVVTASSTSGAACVAALREQHAGKVLVRAIFRTEAKAAALRKQCVDGDGVQIVTSVDASEPTTLVAALEGVDAAFIVTPYSHEHDIADDAALTANMINAAAECGVRHVVLCSSWTVAAADRVKLIASRFVPSEALLRRLEKEKGMTWTTLRGGSFFENFIEFYSSLRSSDILAFPDLTFPPMDPRDIGRVAATILAAVGAGHAGRAYDISGGEMLSTKDMAQTFSKVLGREISFSPVPVTTYVSSLPPFLAEALEYMAEKGSSAIPISSDVELVTGRPPVTLAEWLEENRSSFSKTA